MTIPEYERVFVGLGSNLGNRLSYLKSAVDMMSHQAIHPVEASSVYESAAHVLEGAAPGADYLNAVVEVRVDRSPAELLEALKEVERNHGRDRSATGRWAARTLDLDILLFGTRSQRDPELTIPHPRIADRRFVLEPLAEIAPSVRVPHPHLAPVAALLERCPDQTPIRVVFPPTTILSPS